MLPGVLLQITRAMAGGSDRAEILYQVNGPIAYELRPSPWLDGRQASLTHRFNGHTKNRHMAAEPRIGGSGRLIQHDFLSIDGINPQANQRPDACPNKGEAACICAKIFSSPATRGNDAR